MPNFSIGGNLQTSYSQRAFGGYLDRQAINAPGASWLVRISPTSAEVDMEAIAGHIYQNQYVCRFGQTSFNLSCGTVYLQNALVDHWNGSTVFASIVNRTCLGGDSGGPVWYYSAGKRYPIGLISGSTYADGHCMLVALDDQLSGTGWSLL